MAEDGNFVGINDFESQFHQVFKNLKGVLDGLGITHDHIAQINAYLVQEQHVELFDKLCREYFPTIFKNGFPAKTLVIVKSLAREEFLFEVDEIATANS